MLARLTPFLLLCLSCPFPLGECNPPPAGPRDFTEPFRQPVAYDAVLVCDEPMHDFGTVWAGPRLTHTFEVRNGGSETVWVRRSIAGLTPFIPCRFKLEPGQAVYVPFSLDSTKLRGRFRKAITLRAIDPLDDETCCVCWRSYDSEHHDRSCGPVCRDCDETPWCIRRGGALTHNRRCIVPDRVASSPGVPRPFVRSLRQSGPPSRSAGGRTSGTGSTHPSAQLY